MKVKRGVRQFTYPLPALLAFDVLRKQSVNIA